MQGVNPLIASPSAKRTRASSKQRVDPLEIPMDVPFKSRRKPLTPEQEKAGAARIAAAYKKIDAALRGMDRRIAALEHTLIWKILVSLGTLLFLTGVALLVAAFFRETKLELLGKDGAVPLLFTTGVSLLTGLAARHRNLKTLSSRIRTRLRACQAQPYEDAIGCMQSALRELDQAFALP